MGVALTCTVPPGWPQRARPPGMNTAECVPCSAITTMSLFTPVPCVTQHQAAQPSFQPKKTS